jgi:hypothetical protein
VATHLPKQLRFVTLYLQMFTVKTSGLMDKSPIYCRQDTPTDSCTDVCPGWV